MPSSTEKFTVGIEEEYLLIDPETRDLISEPSDAVLQDCEAAIDASVGGVRPEFLRAQVEESAGGAGGERGGQCGELVAGEQEALERRRVQHLPWRTHSSVRECGGGLGGG